MSQYNSQRSDRSGTKPPYYLVREKRPFEVYQSIDGKISLDGKKSISRERYIEDERPSYTERSLRSHLQRPALEHSSQTKSHIQKQLYEKFLHQLIDNNNDVSARKSPQLSMRKNSPDGERTMRTSGGSTLKVKINPNPNKFNYKKPAQNKRELIETLSPKFVIDSIYSYKYITKSIRSSDPNKTARGLSMTNGNLSRRGSKTNLSLADEDQSKVLNRLYAHKSIIKNFASAPAGPQLIGVKDIINRAENSINRSFNPNQSVSMAYSSRPQSPRGMDLRTSKNQIRNMPQLIEYSSNPPAQEPQLLKSNRKSVKKNKVPTLEQIGIPQKNLSPTVTLTTTNTRRTNLNESGIPEYDEMNAMPRTSDENTSPNVFDGFGAYFSNSIEKGYRPSFTEEDQNEYEHFSKQRYDSEMQEVRVAGEYVPSNKKLANFHDALKSIVLKGGQTAKYMQNNAHF